MKISLFALALAMTPPLALTPMLTTPAAAQTRAQEARWTAAQRRFERERTIYERERVLYENSRRGRDRYRGDRYDRDDSERYGWRRDGADDWEPSRYYREDSRYQERRLSSQDEVYRGRDGRYYCRRSDGTTGLVIGAGVGALLGRSVDTRGERTTGTVVGGVLGALLGRSIERDADLRCR
jgi:hypothetical protein